MKYLFILVLLMVLISCTKKNKNNELSNISENGIYNEIISSSNDLHIDSHQIIFLTMYVTAPEGLNLRSEPSTQSEIVRLLPFSTEVQILNTDNNLIIIDGIESKWYEVNSNNSVGWVFGGYLSDKIENAKELFFENPFIDTNIVIPNKYTYSSFDELFNLIGNPISEFETETIFSHYEGNYDRGFEYNYFDVYSVYVASNDVVIITMIWLNMKDNILYSFNIMKNDNPGKIIKLFGNPFHINEYSNGNLIEYLYKVKYYQISFQFDNNKLTSVIYHLMP
jgi:hypothetical protein